MDQYPSPVPPEKRRKILIFGIVPVLLLLLAVLLYVQFSPLSAAKPPSPKANLPVPDHSRTDTSTAGKSDLYAILEDREKKDSEGKAIFNTNEKLNLGTDPGPDQDLKNRLAREVVKPSPFDDGSFPTTHRSAPADDRPAPGAALPGGDPDNASFNSIVIASPDDKKPAFPNLAVPTSAEVNCPAFIRHKTKATEGGSVTMELEGDLTIQGDTLPKGSAVTATVQLGQNRVDLHINSVNIGGKIVSVRLTAFDTDGLEGLRIQGNTALKRGANQTVDDQIEAVGNDAESQLSGLGGQAVGSIVRNLVHPGGRRDEATIPAGYRVILKTN